MPKWRTCIGPILVSWNGGEELLVHEHQSRGAGAFADAVGTNASGWLLGSVAAALRDYRAGRALELASEVPVEMALIEEARLGGGVGDLPVAGAEERVGAVDAEAPDVAHDRTAGRATEEPAEVILFEADERGELRRGDRLADVFLQVGGDLVHLFFGELAEVLGRPPNGVMEQGGGDEDGAREEHRFRDAAASVAEILEATAEPGQQVVLLQDRSQREDRAFSEVRAAFRADELWIEIDHEHCRGTEPAYGMRRVARKAPDVGPGEFAAFGLRATAPAHGGANGIEGEHDLGADVVVLGRAVSRYEFPADADAATDGSDGAVAGAVA